MVQREQDAQAVDVAQRVEHGGRVLHLPGVGEHRRGVAHLVGIDDAHIATGLGNLVHAGDASRLRRPSSGCGALLR